MGVRFYVSTANAPFFLDNVMGYGDSAPVTGDYKVGDFIISSTQADGIFGWVCTKAGTPGTWEIIGSGKSGGGEILDNSIGIEKLTPELVEMINNHKDPRVGELNNLQTTAKTDVVAAINEIKGKADEAFQSGNNAKQGLVDALIAKGAEASTSETWKILNDKVKNLKTNGKKWASGVVDYNYDYASPAGGTVRNLAFKPSLICLCEKGGDKPNYFVGVIANIPGFKTGFNWALNHDGYSDITTEFDDVNYQILDDGFHFYLRSNIHTYQGSVNWMAFE